MTYPHPTLEHVRHAFEQWRQQKHHRDPIPQPLRQQALTLLGRYPASQITKTLRINHTMLRQWQEKLTASTLAAPKTVVADNDHPYGSADASSDAASLEFIELPRVSELAEITEREPQLSLTWSAQRSTGQQLSVKGQLTLTQWRQAVQLLNQEAGRS
jgi:hypothetical protein